MESTVAWLGRLAPKVPKFAKHFCNDRDLWINPIPFSFFKAVFRKTILFVAED